MGVKVGNYVIMHPENGKVWIKDAVTGEGGRFDVNQVLEALNELWAKYF